MTVRATPNRVICVRPGGGWHRLSGLDMLPCSLCAGVPPGGLLRPDGAYPSSVGTVRPAHLESRLELADVGRLARRLLRRAVAAARTEDAPVQRALWEHLGPQAADVPVVRATWPGYDRVNVQVGLDAWLAGPGRRHELAGITGFHPGPGLADLVQNEQWRGVRMGSPATDLLPAGPGGVTLACLQCALCLVTGGERRLALLIQAAGPEVHVDAACGDVGRARQVIDQIRRLAIERNVFRGHVIGFGGEVFGPRRQELLSFLERPEVGREQVILPPDLLERIERQVVGVARHVSSLRASGQHLKRGVLLHGPPSHG
jgi:cell division protease FtsH